jgi:hypothetical protein
MKPHYLVNSKYFKNIGILADSTPFMTSPYIHLKSIRRLSEGWQEMPNGK